MSYEKRTMFTLYYVHPERLSLRTSFQLDDEFFDTADS